MAKVSAGGHSPKAGGKSPVPGTVPGDRGDASMARGCAGLKSKQSPAMPTKFRSKCSAGYEDAPTGFYGNVKR